MVETVSSLKVARSLNRHWGLRENPDHSLKILIQINTSREESKLCVCVCVCVITIILS